MQEIWKPVPGFDGFYEASSLGNIRSLRRYTRCVSKAGKEFKKLQGGENLRLVPHNAGYLHVIFSAGGVRTSHLAHRVIATTFLDNPLNLPWVNHKDADKRNNKVENLEWCTASQNYRHAEKLGLFPLLVGSQKGSAKLNEDKVHIIKKMILLGYENTEIASFFKVSTAPISYIRNNQAWTHVPW